jgi:hypothetical protein
MTVEQSLGAPVMWRDTGVAKVSVVAAVKVAVLRLSCAKDYWRIATTMVGLPTASSWVRAATIPDQFLAATLTVTIGSDPSFFYFLRSEFVIVRHQAHLHIVSGQWERLAEFEVAGSSPLPLSICRHRASSC